MVQREGKSRAGRKAQQSEAPASAPSNLPPARAKALAAALEHWFEREGRDLPWRRTRDPYAVLVSEVMLQQTQVATVLQGRYFERWMQRFPDLATLATADEQEILACWQGLGYYRRARHLQRLAQHVIEQHGGQFPETHSQMLQLPGVGRYTAGALASFCFGLAEPLVDGNVSRVLSRLHNSALPVDSSQGIAQLWCWAADLVDASNHPRALNSALMELGQRHCRPKQVECEVCPVQRWCRAQDPLKLPIKANAVQITAVEEAVAWIWQEGRLLMEQEQGKRRTGLWKLPPLSRQPAGVPLWSGSYAITRYRVSLSVHGLGNAAAGRLLRQPGRKLQWFAPGELAALPVASPYRRALEALLPQD